MIDIKLKEDDSRYDGPLSYAAEWHAMTIGIGTGFGTIMATIVGPIAVTIMAALTIRLIVYSLTRTRVQVGQLTIDLPTTICQQIKHEPHYLVGGTAIGIALGLGALAAISYTIKL